MKFSKIKSGKLKEPKKKKKNFIKIGEFEKPGVQ